MAYDPIIDELTTLVAFAPPSFIFIHDPISPATTSAAVRNALTAGSSATDVRLAFISGISCFVPRILYDSIMNALAGWTVKWEDGCANWSLPSDMASPARRWNDSFDAFLHGLRAVDTHIRSSKRMEKEKNGRGKGKGKNKGKEKQVEVQEQDLCFVIVIECAERLKDTMPDLLVPLTRLSELSQLDLSVIFISPVRWEDMKPPLGASPDPYFIDIPPPTKEQITTQLESSFDTISRTTTRFPQAPQPTKSTATKSQRGKNSFHIDTPTSTPGPYHPSLRQLYSHFASILCDVCYPFTRDPQEIQYIASARWPGFVQPVLDEHVRRIERLQLRRAKQAGLVPRDVNHMDVDDDEYESDDGDDSEALRPPNEDTRMRLSRLFKPTLTIALEELYPRLTNAAAWARFNSSPPDLDIQGISLSRPSSPVKPGGITPFADDPSSTPHTPRRNRTLRSSVPNTPHTPRTPRTAPAVTYSHNLNQNSKDLPVIGLVTLPRISKFILIASFLASTNPAKSDLRMFGRGLDEKKRRRRRTVSTGSAKSNGAPAKVPQRLLGPAPFPLDRMLAILGALMEENDVEGVDARMPADEQFRIPGEYTDMEISRVGVYTTVVELASMRLLHRTSPADRLEGPPMFKCGVSYDEVLGLAKELDVPFNDLLCDPV
ncbi:hypothetical protein AX17_002189 [Amanita inopinata Kibby_2008]|nr:hypothetical protein AX17_002189 [Amanita inopinata Kibby_2008]